MKRRKELIAFFRASLVILLCCLFNSCGQRVSNPEEARIKLAQMNITYSEDSFFNKVQEGDVLAVKLFLQAGMDPNLKNKYGLTPLIVAAKAGRLEVLKLLVNNGADLHIKLENGNDALDLATDRGHKDIEHFLIKKGLTPTYNNLLKQFDSFVEMGKKGDKIPQDVIKLFEKKCERYDKQRQTLDSPIFYGNVAAVNLMIDQGIMINTGRQGITPLMVAIVSAPQQDIMSLVRILVYNGASVNLKSQLGWSPLLLAIQRLRKGNEIRKNWISGVLSPPLTPPTLNDKFMLPNEVQDPVIQFLISAGAKNDL
jgi:ankyrin repeat protein